MRLAVAALGLVLLSGQVLSQQTPTPDPSKDSQNSTGRTVIPEKQGPAQLQGNTGPLETKSGGAPAESPQGQMPPGMQPAPAGSSKTIVDAPAKKWNTARYVTPPAATTETAFAALSYAVAQLSHMVR